MKPPSAAELDAAVERLVRWGARTVILYGSVARGDYTGSSDIDLIVVKETPDRLPERIAQALDLCREAMPPLPVELLVYTPAEFARMVAEQNPLIGEAQRHGRVLHDAA